MARLNERLILVLIFGWSFGAWLERRRERRRLARAEPAPTTDRTGWRMVLGLPMSRAPEDSARLKALEDEAYKAIREHHGDRGHGEAT